MAAKRKVKEKVSREHQDFRDFDDIKKFYIHELTRVRDYADIIETEAIREQVKLAQEHILELQVRKADTDESIARLQGHVNEIRKKLNDFEKKKHTEEETIVHISDMKGKLANHLNHLKKVIGTKKDLLKKESSILREMNELFENERVNLAVIDKYAVQELTKKQTPKRMMLQKANNLLKDEFGTFKFDMKALDSISESGKKDIMEITEMIKRLDAEKVNMLHRISLTKASGKGIEDDIERAKIERDKLVGKLAASVNKYIGIDVNKFRKKVDRYLDKGAMRNPKRGEKDV